MPVAETLAACASRNDTHHCSSIEHAALNEVSTATYRGHKLQLRIVLHRRELFRYRFDCTIRGGKLSSAISRRVDGTNGMGRRDEPELDELSKLLRRLETMEVAPKQESARKAEPDAAQPQAEYVGALRGAAPAKVSDGRSGSAYDARSYRAHETQPSAGEGRPARRARRQSSSVQRPPPRCRRSSLPDWCCGRSGGQKSDGERRLTFYAPTEPARATQTPRRRRGCPGGSAAARIPRRRQMLRRCCSAPTSTFAAASPARRGSCWSRPRSLARASPP